MASPHPVSKITNHKSHRLQPPPLTFTTCAHAVSLRQTSVQALITKIPTARRFSQRLSKCCKPLLSNYKRRQSRSLNCARACHPAQYAHDKQNWPQNAHHEEDLIVQLPQHATSMQKQRRSARIEAQRNAYRWTYQAVGEAALIDGLPASETPSRRWVVRMKRIEDRIQKNSQAIVKKKAQQAKKESVEKSNQEDLFQEYKDQFINIDISAVASNNQFLQDDIFGWYRIAGPNPMQLQLVREDPTIHFPQLTDEIFRQISHFEHDTIASAFQERRLFMIDYSILTDLQTPSSTSHTPKANMYLYAPKALFAIPKSPQSLRQSLLPIAIHCDQARSSPMYTAAHTHTHADTWQSAKLCVQVADAYTHETVHHFARTHLLTEVFVCATHRTLDGNHPIARLLHGHFEGTAFINESSLQTLICTDGVIDRITAPTIQQTQRLAGRSVLSFDFNASMPDTELRRRGVHADEAPLLHFPYRDDALRLWEALGFWVTDFVHRYYESDEDVQWDSELQAWGEEIRTRGRIQGFGEGHGKIGTREYLIRAITMVIFTASVQHAAVNFPQATHMQFAPAMPLAGYAEAPAGPPGRRTGVGERGRFLSMLPDVRQAEQQLCAAESLGVLRISRLGEYGSRLEFGGLVVRRAVERLLDRLADIQMEVEHRNVLETQCGLSPYDFLAPSNIPQSTNV